MKLQPLFNLTAFRFNELAHGCGVLHEPRRVSTVFLKNKFGSASLPFELFLLDGQLHALPEPNRSFPSASNGPGQTTTTTATTTTTTATATATAGATERIKRAGRFESATSDPDANLHAPSPTRASSFGTRVLPFLRDEAFCRSAKKSKKKK